MWQDDDEDLVEYLNELRLSILEALTGITQGLNNESDNSQRASRDERVCIVWIRNALTTRVRVCGGAVERLVPFVPQIVNFMKVVAEDESSNCSEEIVVAITALIGCDSAVQRSGRVRWLARAGPHMRGRFRSCAR